MNDRRKWIPALLVGLCALASPVGAQIDLVCPLCDADVAPLEVGQVVELVLTTVLHKGVSVLLLGATAVVSLPWMIAGAAIAAFYLPRWIRGLVLTRLGS